MLSPMLPMITESLLNLAILFSHEVLSLVLETLAMVLAVRIASLFNLQELLFPLNLMPNLLVYRWIKTLLLPANQKFARLPSPFSLSTIPVKFINVNLIEKLFTSLYPDFLFKTDPVIVELAQDIFRELSQNEACLGPLQHRLVPTLVSILQSPSDKVPSGMIKNDFFL